MVVHDNFRDVLLLRVLRQDLCALRWMRLDDLVFFGSQFPRL